MEITTKQAVEQLRKVLREDKDYYYSWQANIAVAFQDLIEYSEVNLSTDTIKIEAFKYCIYGRDKIHEIANMAADNFLKQLIS